MTERIKCRIPLKTRWYVWNKWIGIEKGYGYCYIGCSRIIYQQQFECGHIISEKKGGTIDPNNLRPICSTCNKCMGQMNLYEYKKIYSIKNNVVSSNKNILLTLIKSIFMINSNNTPIHYNNITQELKLLASMLLLSFLIYSGEIKIALILSAIVTVSQFTSLLLHIH